jgi:pimeloyl-ACP methyl ester carboxylesterase
MKSKYLFLLFLFLSNACTREKEVTAVTYTPVAAGKCSVDATNGYHYILPVNHKGSLPLLIILDSGGDGLMAVNKTRPAVSQIPCVVVGSDLVRNNYPGYEQAIEILINDACQKFKATREQVFIAGFSGGARMAFEYAREHPVKGVLMCGAGPAVSSFQELPCPVYMIAGTTDFNFSETYFNPLSKSVQQSFLADYFRGKHEWPPAEMLKEGLLFLMGHSISGGARLLKQESALLSEKADSLLAKNENLFALKAVEKALIFNPDNKPAKKQLEKIKNDRKFAGNISQIESDLALENRINQAYSIASMEHDSIWWAKEIKQLSLEITNHTGDQKDHYMRIKSFLGILFYSQLNNLIRSQPDNKQIVHMLAAYKMAEPENPDVYYDYALYSSIHGKVQLSRKYLLTALSLGFQDRVKLANDFPGFRPADIPR